jgi:5-methylcytosine-specific restriction endonuclease McrA
MAHAIISRKEARAQGLKRFFTGKPCKYGHIAERFVTTEHCMACHRLRERTHYADRTRKEREMRQVRDACVRAALQKKFSRPIITREEAKAAGLTRYFSGEACKFGHVSERYVSGTTCVVCNREKEKAYRAVNHEKLRSSQRAYYYEHADEIRAKARERIAGDQEKKKRAAHARNRIARKKLAEGSHTADDIQRIYQAQKGKCAYCRQDVGNKYQVDHIIALSNGGSNDRRNLQITCGPCNTKKRARDPLEYARSLGLLL